ncbi:MAG: hypothetical protein KGL15_04865 [Acidobacteriota bacterium]|nr:hypothetical protein [Acidobacteriota bacterium]
MKVGAIAGMAGGMMMAMWQMIVGAIAKEPTAVPGIHSTFWTPVEGIWSVIFGVHHFHGDWHTIPVLGGMAGHMMNSMILGIMGVALIAWLLGRRPNPMAAIMLAVGYGIVVNAILIVGIINHAQKIETLYRSTPAWSWWVAHAIFGMTLGILGALLLRREQRSADKAQAALDH